LRIILCVSIALASASVSRAQLPDMQPLAASMARAIAKSRQKSVVVLDFVGPEKISTELGRTLAEKFSADLAKSSDKFLVIGRERIAENLAKKDLATLSVTNIDIATWVAGDLGALSVVFGTLAASGDRLGIEIDCYGVKSGKWIDGFKTASSISDEMKKMMSQTIEYPTPASDSGLPAPGKNGYTYPKCVYCPQAVYTNEAVKDRLQGTVILKALVGTDGKADDIVVKKPLRDGLTEKAIEAVKSWKFTPALGPDGKPAAVWQAIEVTFHLFSM
jgi:protein TonB